MVISPTVAAETRAQFGCDTVPGAALENEGGQGSANAHWEYRWFQGELMVATNLFAVRAAAGLGFVCRGSLVGWLAGWLARWARGWLVGRLQNLSAALAYACCPRRAGCLGGRWRPRVPSSASGPGASRAAPPQVYGKPATMSRITLAFMQDTGWCAARSGPMRSWRS